MRMFSAFLPTNPKPLPDPRNGSLPLPSGGAKREKAGQPAKRSGSDTGGGEGFPAASLFLTHHAVRSTQHV